MITVLPVYIRKEVAYLEERQGFSALGFMPMHSLKV